MNTTKRDDRRGTRRGWAWVAAGLAVVMTGVHVIVGGWMIAGPLLESGLETLPRMTLYSPLDLPQWIAFGPMAMAAGLALRTGRGSQAG